MHDTVSNEYMRCVFVCRIKPANIYSSYTSMTLAACYLSICFHFYCEYFLNGAAHVGIIQQVIISRVNRWRNEYDYYGSWRFAKFKYIQKLFLWRENSFINLESIKSFAVMPTALLAKFISFFSVYRAGLLWFFFCCMYSWLLYGTLLLLLFCLLDVEMNRCNKLFA